jgi:hypothetical protein
MGTEMVPEKLVIFNQLTWLIAQEDLINFSNCESFRSYILSYVCKIKRNLHLQHQISHKLQASAWVNYVSLFNQLSVYMIPLIHSESGRT